MAVEPGLSSGARSGWRGAGACLRRGLHLTRQRWLWRSCRRRRTVLVAGLAILFVWQIGLKSAWRHLDSHYALRASSGIRHERDFVYFLYYLGLYPVATEEPNPEESVETARKTIQEHGSSLVMEKGHSIRYGDNGKACFLYLFSAWLNGSPQLASLHAADAAWFWFALALLWFAFWRIGLPWVGCAAVLLSGSDPFQLHEAYRRGNVFSWVISTGLVLAALYLPLLAEKPPRRLYLWGVVIGSGVLLATVRQIRTEPVFVLAGAALACLLLARRGWAERLMLVAALAVTFVCVQLGWRAYFDWKFEQAYQVVKAAGGHPYDGPRGNYHMIWHPLWCGLGDFDTQHGYAWDDRVAARYALPILEQRYGLEPLELAGDDYVFKDRYWDADRKYYKTPYELPHYDEVLREKIVSDIRGDPLWYVDILLKRIGRILTETTPVGLELGPVSFHVPFSGLWLAPALLLLWWARAWFFVKLIFFGASLSLPALVIYSDRGMCYYSIYHVLAAAVLAALLLELALAGVARARAGPAVDLRPRAARARGD